MSLPISLPPISPPTLTAGVATNAAVSIERNGRAVAADLAIRIDPTAQAGVIDADGRRLLYHGTVAPPLAIPENSLLTVTDYPGNDVLADGAQMLVQNVRQRGNPVPATLFDLYRKAQP